MTTTFKLLGTDDAHSTCDACGKRNLKYVVVLENRETGDIVRYGCDCAAVALRYGTKGDRKAADRVWFQALQQNRRQKGVELGLRVRAEIEANPITVRDLTRDLDTEAKAPGYFCFRAPTGAVVYVRKGEHTRADCVNEHGETLKETAVRLYPGALLRLRVLELHAGAPGHLDRGLDEGAAHQALVQHAT